MMVRMGVVEGAGGEGACGVGVGEAEMNGEMGCDVMAVFVDFDLGVDRMGILSFVELMRETWGGSKVLGIKDTVSGSFLKEAGYETPDDVQLVEQADLIVLWVHDAYIRGSVLHEWLDRMRAEAGALGKGVVVYAGRTLAEVEVLK